MIFEDSRKRMNSMEHTLVEDNFIVPTTPGQKQTSGYRNITKKKGNPNS
jgi:hypothetical protein